MSCRFRYEDLPPAWKAQVDRLLRRRPAQPGPAYAQHDLPGIVRRAGPGRRQPNKTEARYRAEVLARRGDLAAVHYEGLTLRMANGHRYTPDWLVVTRGGRIEFHEVKGRYALGSHQRARLAFDQARVEFPWAVWIWAQKTEHGWKIGGQDAV